MSVRQSIVEAVVARLQTIQRANGYSSDLGYNVYEWRVAPLTEAELPAVVVRDLRNEPEELGIMGQFCWRLGVELEVVVSSGNTTAEDMRGIVADVYTAVGTDFGWSALADYTTQPMDEMTVEQDEKLIAGARLSFVIGYRAAQWGM